MCAALALMPVAFGACVLANLTALAGLPTWFMGLLAGVYAAIPLLLATLVLFKQRSIFYALIGECLALVLTSLSQPGQLPTFLYLVHYTLVIAMVSMAILLINRDILFPFALPVSRGWRRAPRIEVNQRVKLTIPRLQTKITLMVEDASVSGISLYASSDSVEKAATDIKPGEAVIMSCSLNGNRHEVRLDYVWQTQMSTVLKLGFRAFDTAEMQAFLQDLLPAQPPRTRTSRRRINEAWARPRVRRVLNYALALGLLSVMILPPLVRNGPPIAQLPTYVQQLFNGKDGSGAPTKRAPHLKGVKPPKHIAH